jgi:hypothetical protein
MENEACMKKHPAFSTGRKPGRADFEAVVDEVIHSAASPPLKLYTGQP